jgi:hypothetical protein
MLAHHIHRYLLEKLKSNDILNYLEIGVFDGDNLNILSDVFPNKHFYGIDPFIEDGNTSQITHAGIGTHLSSLKLICNEKFKNKKNVTLFEIDSTIFNQDLSIEESQKFNTNIVLIDGNHNHPYVERDIDLALKLIGNKSGIFILDDIVLKDVNTAIRYAIGQSKNRLSGGEYIHTNAFAFELDKKDA